MALWCEIVMNGLPGGWPLLASVGGLASQAAVWGASEPSLLSSIGSQLFVWISVAVGIGLVIFVHELGHFLAAKSFGVKVEKFYVGFDVPIKIGPIRFPRTLGKFRWGETEYGIGVIPLGGYVKMLGQDDDPRKAEEEAARIRQAAAEGTGEVEEEGEAELDPRSYPAKSVGQRMVIISAGVVMNVITGILFAAFAYGALGVEYTPAIIGGVTAGDPAYQAGIELDGKVISVDGSEDDEQMHFRRMTMKVLTHGMAHPDEPVAMRIRYPDGVREYQIETSPDPQMPARHLVGVAAPLRGQLSRQAERVAERDTPAAAVLEEADAGARIVAIDGEPLPASEGLDAPLSQQVMRRMIERASQPVTLTLQRLDGEAREVTIPPQPMKQLGFALGLGPVSSLVQEGPAETAGIQVGDQIISVDGETTLEAFQLPLQLLAREDTETQETVTLRVRRGAGSEAEELEMTIEPRPYKGVLGPFSSQTGQVSLDTLGLAYRPSVRMATSRISDLAPGDRLRNLTIQWPSDEVREDYQEIIAPTHLEAITQGWDASAGAPLTSLIDLLQLLPKETKFQAVFERASDGKVIERTVTLRESEAFWPTRGVMFEPVQFEHEVSSFSAAMGLGLREAKWRMGEVFQFLKLLGTGRVNRKQVGGPVKIVQIAAGEAERGASALLLFLTMLSMNLAILNFLPIPALDGGHMVFLVAEAVLGRPVDEKLQMQLTMAGVLALLGLMVFVFANDLLPL